MHIKKLCEEAHKNAIDKGFWIPQEDVVEGKIPNVRYRNIPELLMLIVSELGEACEALRKNNYQKFKEPWTKDTFEDEIADCFIRLADLCQALKIDIEYFIEKKMEYNKGRERLHGKKF